MWISKYTAVPPRLDARLTCRNRVRLPDFEVDMRAVVPAVDVVEFPGIGHWTQQEAPAATNEALFRFLRQRC